MGTLIHRLAAAVGGVKTWDHRSPAEKHRALWAPDYTNKFEMRVIAGPLLAHYEHPDAKYPLALEVRKAIETIGGQRNSLRFAAVFGAAFRKRANAILARNDAEIDQIGRSQRFAESKTEAKPWTDRTKDEKSRAVWYPRRNIAELRVIALPLLRHLESPRAVFPLNEKQWEAVHMIANVDGDSPLNLSAENQKRARVLLDRSIRAQKKGGSR